ncbi:MAG: fumarylacetoacetate hydrolase family protein [Balneolaceae bacterium]
MRQQIPGIDGLEINTLFCIGRNYILHARELNNPVPEEPIVFLKPNSAVIMDGGTVSLPAQSRDVHHEVELVIAIGKTGKKIPEEEALNYIAGYGIGIDFTARDIQQKAKEKGKPWSVAKGFDTFAPVSRFLPYNGSKPFPDVDLELQINGETRQKGNTRDMLFSIPTLISYLSHIFTLSPGDLLFTGTPEGVGTVQPGDEITAILGNQLQTLQLHVA